MAKKMQKKWIWMIALLALGFIVAGPLGAAVGGIIAYLWKWR
jgi:hypothetical protein